MLAFFYYNDSKGPDIGKMSWLPMCNFPSAPIGELGYFQRVIAVNGYLYITNGTSEKGKSFYRFDPYACQWDAINFCHPTDPSNACSLVYLDGWIYALGGQSLKDSGAQWARRYSIHVSNVTPMADPAAEKGGQVIDQVPHQQQRSASMRCSWGFGGWGP